VDFYLSIFHNSRKLNESRWPAGHPAAGKVITLAFELDGQKFTALNGGPQFHFNEAISLSVRCESQAEVDYYWERLSEGGGEGRCAWLKDKFGLSWQVVPTRLPELIQHPKALQAMMGMSKINLEDLERAANS